MAISDDLPGVEVSITQNGQALKEYLDDTLTEDERTVTRYIEATSDENSELCLKATRGTAFDGDCMGCRVEIDGQRIAEPLLEKSRTKSEDHIAIVEGIGIGGGTVKRFKFACLETANDGRAFTGEVDKVKKLGSIVVTVRQELLIKKSKAKQRFQKIETAGVISEKALKGKALSHSIEFGDAVKRNVNEGTDFWSTKPVKGSPDPAAVFIFNYRSIEALKSMLIIPRTPSPPLLEERDFTTLSQAELADLHKQFKAMKEAQAAAVKIKRERTDDNPRPRKISRPKAGDTQLEIDDEDHFRECSSSTLAAAEPEIIELD